MPRHDGRADDALRPVKITPGYLDHPAGSALIEVGRTRVICTATIEDKVPLFLQGKGEGWVTGEYGMLPGATDKRTQREATRGRPGGRTLEIQRLIGRALRAVVDRRALGERTFWIDCDVIQADGGTRTASVTGGYVALCLALATLRPEKLAKPPLCGPPLAAVSVGVLDGRPVLDLDYAEDSSAEVDMNVIAFEDGRYVEIQGTAEGAPYRREMLDRLLGLAERGIQELAARQRAALGSRLDTLLR